MLYAVAIAKVVDASVNGVVVTSNGPVYNACPLVIRTLDIYPVNNPPPSPSLPMPAVPVAKVVASVPKATNDPLTYTFV